MKFFQTMVRQYGLGDGIATVFLDAGCKVAVFDVDSGQGSKMAREKGVRFYEIDVNDTTAVEKAFADLLKAWRDVDIIINMEAGEDYRVAIARMWSEHKTRYPFYFLRKYKFNTNWR